MNSSGDGILLFQDSQDCHLGEVDRAYNRGLEALESWKRTEVNVVEEQHRRWVSVCDDGTKHLQAKIDEGKTLISKTNALLSTPKAVFVRVNSLTVKFWRLLILVVIIEGNLLFYKP